MKKKKYKKRIPVDAFQKLNKGGPIPPKTKYKRNNKMNDELNDLLYYDSHEHEYCPFCDELLYFEDYCDLCGWANEGGINDLV